MRTADDALMRVKLMIFYEVKDIDRMVSNVVNISFDNGLCLLKPNIITKFSYMDVFSCKLHDICHNLFTKTIAVALVSSILVYGNTLFYNIALMDATKLLCVETLCVVIAMFAEFHYKDSKIPLQTLYCPIENCSSILNLQWLYFQMMTPVHSHCLITFYDSGYHYHLFTVDS